MLQGEIWRLELRLRRVSTGGFYAAIERTGGEPQVFAIAPDQLFLRLQELLNNHLRAICNQLILPQTRRQ
jgi:hypothetical protein